MDWAPPSRCGAPAAEELVEPEPWERSLLGQLAASSTWPWHACLEKRLAMVPNRRNWMSEDLEGGCACGAARFRLTSAPMFVHCCHCRDCQRQTGSAFVLNALIETDRIILLSGALEPVAVPTDSGRPHDIHRCRACQTALWSDYGRRPALRFVRVGTLDEPARLPPDVHIYTRSSADGSSCRRRPRFRAYYDTKASASGSLDAAGALG